MKSEELLSLLGKVTGNGQALEYGSCLVLGKCLGISEDTIAIRVGQRLPMNGRLDLIAELVRIGPSPMNPTRVREWVSLAKAASEHRNTIVHSAWLGDPTTDEYGGALTKKGTHEPEWGQARLQDAIAHLRKAIDGAVALLGEGDATSRV